MIEGIEGYEPGSNVLLLNTFYDRPKCLRDAEGKPTYTKGTLYQVFRDLDTGDKRMCKRENPTTHTYITKPELRKSYNTQRQYMKLEDVDRFEVPYKDMTKFIYDKIREDGIDTYYCELYEEALRIRKPRMKNMVYRWRHSYYADYDITDYFTTQSLLQYKPQKVELTKAFADIETDIYKRSKEDHDSGLCPINAVSAVYTHNPDGDKLERPLVVSLFVRNHTRYKGQQEVEDNLDEFIADCHAEFDKDHGVMDYKIVFLDDELELISNFFGIIHLFKPDFCHFWNMSYDIPYFIKRIRYHGYEPEEFFNHKDFGQDFKVFYYLDAFFKNDIPNRCDYFQCASYTKYIDQMNNYAGIRKGTSDYGGTSLDNVAKITIGSKKKEFDDPSVTVINAAIYEYWNFAKYSINDVLLQYSIDKKTDDTYVVFDQSYHGGTQIDRTLKQSKYLKNVYDIDYFEMGLVQHNNLNIDYCSDDRTNDSEVDYDNIKLNGALVGIPELNYDNGVKVFGKPSRYRYKLCIDFDYASMYPNSKIKFNVASHTQYFRVIIEKPVLANDNPLNDPLYMRGGKFVDDLIVNDMNKLGKWFSLPSIDDLCNDFEKEVM